MKKVYKLENLGCPSCAAKMEEAIGQIDGVNSCVINFMTAKLKLDLEDNIDEDSLKEIVKKAQDEVSKVERFCEIV